MSVEKDDVLSIPAKESYSYKYFTEYFQERFFNDSRLENILFSEQIRPEARIALVTGVAGQDGSYLAEYLLSLGYTVYGCDLQGQDAKNIKQLKHQLRWLDIDLTDEDAVLSALRETGINEIYHLASFTHVGDSFNPANRDKIWNDVVVTNHTMLTATQLRIQESTQQIRYFYPGTSELFGNQPTPQSENTPFDPQSPYAEAKMIAVEEVRKFRKLYGMHASLALLFNHGSERRTAIHEDDPEKIEGLFIERKIAILKAQLENNMNIKGRFGNIHAIRDIGYAPEYVRAIFALVQKDTPSEYIVGTGIGYPIDELLTYALWWYGQDIKDYIEIDPTLFRPNEVDKLIADPRKINEELDWKASKDGKDVIDIIFQHENKRIKFLLKETIGPQVDALIPQYLSVFRNILYTFTKEYLTNSELLKNELHVKCQRYAATETNDILIVEFNSEPDKRWSYILSVKLGESQISFTWDNKTDDFIIQTNQDSNTQKAVDTSEDFLEKLKNISFAWDSPFITDPSVPLRKEELELLKRYTDFVFNLDYHLFCNTFGLPENMNYWIFSKLLFTHELYMDNRVKFNKRVEEIRDIISFLLNHNNIHVLSDLYEYIEPFIQ